MSERVGKRDIALVAIVVALAVVTGGLWASSHLSPVSGPVPLVSNDGADVTVENASDLNVQDPFPSNHSVYVETNNGWAYFNSSGRTHATVDGHLTGWTRLRALNVTQHELEINPAGKRRINISDGLTQFAYSSIDEGVVQPEIDWDAPSAGNITISQIPASATYVGLTDEFGNLREQTTPSGGEATFEVSGSRSGDAIIVDQGAPTFANASPTGFQSSEPQQISVDVRDADMAVFDEEIDVTISHNGNQIRDTTISQNQTVTAQIGTIYGGTNTWTVTATDEWGQSSMQSYSYDTPVNLTVRNETRPSEIIDTTEVELQYFEAIPEGQVFNESTTTGKLNLTGLPINRNFVAKAQASGYVDRRIFIDSLYNQDSIYLLNESADFVETVFELEDFSGQFPKEQTVLEVRRYINGSWRTVEGDQFGATNEFPADLLRGARHELRVTNIETGIQRQLGTFRPTVSGVHTVRIDPDLSISLETPKVGVSVDPALPKVPARTMNFSVSIDSLDATDKLQSYTVQLIHENKSGTTLLRDFTGSQPSGETVNFSVDLSGYENGSVRLVTLTETQNGSTQVMEQSYRVSEHRPNKYSLLNVGGRLGDVLGSGVSMLLAVFAVTAMTGLAAVTLPMSTELLGVTALLGFAGFAAIGWLPMSMMLVAGTAWAAFAGLRRLE